MIYAAGSGMFLVNLVPVAYPLGEFMKKWLRTLQSLENGILVTAFIVMTMSSFAQVVNRNLIGAGISWFEELARYCMVYMTLLATEIGLRDGSQLAITAVVDRFHGRGRRFVDLIGKVIITAYSAIVFVTSFTLIEKQLEFGQSSPGLGIPMYIPYFALPLSFGLITIVQAATVLTMSITLLRPAPVQQGGNA